MLFRSMVRIEGLANRRHREKLIFETGRYPGGTIPVMAVSASNKPAYSRVVRQLTEAQVTAYLQPPVSRPTPRPAPHDTSAPATGIMATLMAILRSLIGKT